MDSRGIPIVKLNRPVWPVKKCQMCTQNTASQYIPLMHLGLAWDQYVPEDERDCGTVALCRECFKIARSADGWIMGYTTRNGKTKKYVQEEVFGDPSI